MSYWNQNVSSCGMDINRINKEGSCCITRILSLIYIYIPFLVSMFCHSHARCFTIEPWVYCSAVLKQNGNNKKYLWGYPGENVMTKLLVCLLCACFYPLEFFLWFSVNLRNLDHRTCMTIRKRNWKEVIIANLKIFSTEKVNYGYEIQCSLKILNK